MYCLDTYALYEIHNGNKKFSKILNNKCVIPNIVLAEFYGLLYKRFNEATAEFWKRKLLAITKEVNISTLIDAMKFKIENSNKKLSFFDCVGYQFSVDNNYKFVTGDKEFKDLKGVEFISK